MEIGAGELARMNANGAITTIRLASVDSYFAWTEGRLVFDRVPLGVVLDELSRWYDVDFVLADASLALDTSSCGGVAVASTTAVIF